MKKINLHTHTRRCKHASGDINDYCAEAIRQGIGILGFSEHSPFPDGRFGESRMEFAELSEYLREIQTARELFPQLTIPAGLEIDYRPRLGKAFYQDVYLGEYALEYLIGGIHYSYRDGRAVYIGGATNDEAALRETVKASIELMETGLIRYLTHPDMIAAGYHGDFTAEVRAAFSELIHAANALNIPLEINAYGLRKKAVLQGSVERAPYPWRPFWELAAELGAKAVTGSDAHRPIDVWANTSEAEALAHELGLQVVTSEIASGITGRL